MDWLVIASTLNIVFKYVGCLAENQRKATRNQVITRYSMWVWWIMYNLMGRFHVEFVKGLINGCANFWTLFLGVGCLRIKAKLQEIRLIQIFKSVLTDWCNQVIMSTRNIFSQNCAVSGTRWNYIYEKNKVTNRYLINIQIVNLPRYTLRFMAS